MDLAPPLAAALTLSGAAFGLSGLALASAMLATTAACELVPPEKINAALGQEMLSRGGDAPIAYMSGCVWQAADDGLSMEFRLVEKEIFGPGSPAGLGYLDVQIAALKKAGEPFETLSDIGDAAILTEENDTRFIDMAAGREYLTISLTGGSREAILAIAKIAAEAMRAP